MPMPRRPSGDLGRSRAITEGYGGESGKIPALRRLRLSVVIVETRLLSLNADPVFQDEALSIFDMMDDVETRVARTLPEAVAILLGENFDAFIVEGEAALAVEQCTNARQHFPSLNIVCLAPRRNGNQIETLARQQNISLIFGHNRRQLEPALTKFVRFLERPIGTASEGIDPCHSLIG